MLFWVILASANVAATTMIGQPGVDRDCAVPVESADAYEIVAVTAVAGLPAPLRSFFEANLEQVTGSATRGAAHPATGRLGLNSDDQHHILLDVAAATDSSSDRREAAARFPRDRATADELFKSHGVRRGGSLPWSLLDRYTALRTAFQAASDEAIVVETGKLLHLATDASLPFNTTVGSERVAVGRSDRFSDDPHTETPCQRQRHRFHNLMIKLLRQRLEYEARVWPDRFRYIRDVRAAVFEELCAAHQAIATLEEIDRALPDAEDEAVLFSVFAAPDERQAELLDRVATVLEERLESAALLTMRLVGSAWLEAGKPPVTKSGLDVSSVTTQGTHLDREAGLVGSRNSTVVHRSDCRHVPRIKSHNRVYFATFGDAQAAGRTPCKACKPSAR